MATDEEYLDGLLKLYQEEQTGETEQESGETDKKNTDEPDRIPKEDDWKADLDRLLAVTEEEESGKQEEQPEALPDMDVTQYIDNMEEADADLSEINELLKKSDNNEALDTDDMLALLESFGNGGAEQDEDSETFDVFAEDSGEPNEEPVKKEKKSFFRGKKKFFKKKKNAAGQTEEEEASGEAVSEETISGEDSSTEAVSEEAISTEAIPEWDDIIPERESKKQKKEKGKKEKGKKGFFRQLSDLLFEEAEEAADISQKTDENGEILKELEQEDREKAGKKKKEKKGKSKKKGKQKENVNQEEGTEGEEEAEAIPDKKKKSKKEKKKKEKKPAEKEKRVLSGRALYVLIAFCATLVAAVVLLSLFLPDYADKKNARTAFYTGDYKEAYRLFYDKNRNSSDELIFKRVETVLVLQRKLESYENHKKLGNEEKALDALLQGTAKFEELQTGEQYGAEEELQQIYEKISAMLEQEYGISEEEAKEINSYDADTYSRKIYSVINGTDFIKPGEEIQEEPLPPADVLPEEEDIINREGVSV